MHKRHKQALIIRLPRGLATRYSSSSSHFNGRMEAGQSSSEPTVPVEEEEWEGQMNATVGITKVGCVLRTSSPRTRTTSQEAHSVAIDDSRHEGSVHGDDESHEEKLRLEEEQQELEIGASSSAADGREASDATITDLSTARLDEGEDQQAAGSTAHVATDDKHQENSPSSDVPASSKEPPFAVGDHVYRYNSFFSVHQQHGIVLGVYPATERSKDTTNEHRVDEESSTVDGKGGSNSEGSNSDDDDDWILLIFDFASWNPKKPNESGCGGKTISTSSSTASRSCVRVYESSYKRDKWTKVEYGVSPTNDLGSAVYHHVFGRAGSFTTAQSSPAGWVCARVEFLRLHPDVLPPYSSVSSNAECVAVWCKTGTWATLQASSLLSLTAMGQVKSTATIAGVVGTAQVTVPAAGMWGWLGYTSQVSLLSLHPVLVPAIAAYGVVTIGAPLAWLWRAKKRWKDLTVQLNERFWQFAVEEPDFFVRHVIATADAEGGMSSGIVDTEHASNSPLSLSKSFDQDWIDAARDTTPESSTWAASSDKEGLAARRARLRSV